MMAFISIPITDVIIISGGLLFFLFIHFNYSEIRLVNRIKLSNLTEEETSDICNYIIEKLSLEYRVINPKFTIINYKEDEINAIKYSNSRTLAIFLEKITKYLYSLKY